MICEIARNLAGERLEAVEALERDLGLTLVAFSCRKLEPDREERLRQIMDQFGPQLQTEPAQPDAAQLKRIQEAERALGLSLVAVRP